jgi:hypothetical protein
LGERSNGPRGVRCRRGRRRGRVLCTDLAAGSVGPLAPGAPFDYVSRPGCRAETPRWREPVQADHTKSRSPVSRPHPESQYHGKNSSPPHRP